MLPKTTHLHRVPKPGYPANPNSKPNPSSYLSPKQGGKPPMPPFISILCQLTENILRTLAVRALSTDMQRLFS